MNNWKDQVLFQEIEEILLEMNKNIDIQASSYIELPPKYKKNQSQKYKKRSILFFVEYISILLSRWR